MRRRNRRSAPFKYGGVIVDNAGCDPESWNNHGSICEFNGQWYVLYHRTTNGARSMRKACMEPITFNEDGSINEVEMTSQGAGDPLNAFDKTGAERACLLWGNTRIRLCAPDNEELSGIQNENYAVYRYLDFGDGADSFTVDVTPKAGGKIEVWIDNLVNPAGRRRRCSGVGRRETGHADRKNTACQGGTCPDAAFHRRQRRRRVVYGRRVPFRKAVDDPIRPEQPESDSGCSFNLQTYDLKT